MPNSVREDIIAHIATALGNVTTGNGYENTLASVQRFQQAGLTVATVPTAVVTFVNETKDIGPDFRATCELDVSIDIWAVHDTDAVSGDTATLVDSLAADCEKAVMELGQPQRPIEDALDRAVDWFTSHGYLNAKLQRRVV